jgi:hypothetical protein
VLVFSAEFGFLAFHAVSWLFFASHLFTALILDVDHVGVLVFKAESGFLTFHPKS